MRWTVSLSWFTSKIPQQLAGALPPSGVWGGREGGGGHIEFTPCLPEAEVGERRALTEPSSGSCGGPGKGEAQARRLLASGNSCCEPAQKPGFTVSPEVSHAAAHDLLEVEPRSCRFVYMNPSGDFPSRLASDQNGSLWPQVPTRSGTSCFSGCPSHLSVPQRAGPLILRPLRLFLPPVPPAGNGHPNLHFRGKVLGFKIVGS